MNQTIQHQYRFRGIHSMDVYQAYMTTDLHRAFTKAECSISREIDGVSAMYDGYCHAINISLSPGASIEQQWWANEETWPDGHRSHMLIQLFQEGQDTVLKFSQEGVPTSLRENIEKGWFTYYWEPMDAYLQNLPVLPQ